MYSFNIHYSNMKLICRARERPVRYILSSIQREVTTNYSKGPVVVQTGNARQLAPDRDFDCCEVRLFLHNPRYDYCVPSRGWRAGASITQFAT